MESASRVYFPLPDLSRKIKRDAARRVACIVSTLLYGIESWSTYAGQEKRLNTFHMRCLRSILSTSWTDKVSNIEVLERADIPSMFTLLRQRRLRWLGHVHRMEDRRIPKDLLYTVSWTLGRGLLADLSCASRMSVREACLPLVFQQATGRLMLQIRANGGLYAVGHSR